MAMRRSMLLKDVDFSPTEAADLGLLNGLKRAAIYRKIQHGEIAVIKDRYGHERITLEEIERWKRKRQEEAEKAATDEQLKGQIRSHKNRAAALHRVAITSAGEMIAPMLAGKRRHLEQIVDPEHTCSPQELERRVELEARSQMEMLTAKSLEKVARKRQYSGSRSNSNPP